MKVVGRFVIAVVVLMAVGCSSVPDPHTGLKPQERVRKSADGQSVVLFSQNDPEIKRAVEEARKSLPKFIERLSNARPSEYFQVKVALPTSTGSSENIWMDDLIYENGTFKGKLTDEPFDIAGKHKDSEVSVPEKDVVDWHIVDAEKGTEEGAFSGAALEKVMKAAGKGK